MRSAIYQRPGAARRKALFVAGKMAEATGHSPDDIHCESLWRSGGVSPKCSCKGGECQQLTNGEVWGAFGKDIPPLAEGPTIEAREVGEWKELEE